MKTLVGQMQIQVNENIYLKDPNSSDLGKRIVGQGIVLIDQIGLESFTFRKLAMLLDTTESSIYRYFENKHKLLMYITSWYWGWLEYLLVFSTTNITSPEDRIRAAIKVIAEEMKDSDMFDHIDLGVLYRIVISESSKAFLTKEVDDGNRVGFYAVYKRLIGRISDMVLEINPRFEHPHTLVSTIVEGIHHQKFFADHLPSLTDYRDDVNALSGFYSDMAIAVAKKS